MISGSARSTSERSATMRSRPIAAWARAGKTSSPPAIAISSLTQRIAAWVELLDVLAGLARLAHDPVGVLLGDDVLDLRRVVEREHDELLRVRADGFVRPQ